MWIKSSGGPIFGFLAILSHKGMSANAGSASMLETFGGGVYYMLRACSSVARFVLTLVCSSMAELMMLRLQCKTSILKAKLILRQQLEPC